MNVHAVFLKNAFHYSLRKHPKIEFLFLQCMLISFYDIISKVAME